MTRRSPLPEFLPIRDPKSARAGQGARVLVVADERDLAVRAALRSSAVALATAGYRLSFAAASQDGLISAIGSRLRERSYALVHVHGAELTTVACLAGVLSMPPLLVSMRQPPCKAGVRRWLLGRALATASAIVTCCEDDRTAVLRTFPNLRRRQERIIAIADGVEIPLTPPSPTKGRGGKRERTIGCAVAPDGGREALLEAFARLVRFGNVPPFNVVAFGSVEDLHQAVECRGLQSLIGVREAVDFSSPFDLFVVPSRAGDRAIMQALCAGVPVVAAGGAGLREIVEGTPARVCSADAASLEVALREALNDSRREEARDYAATARERFDARRAAGRLVELYDRLTADVGAVRAA